MDRNVLPLPAEGCRRHSYVLDGPKSSQIHHAEDDPDSTDLDLDDKLFKIRITIGVDSPGATSSGGALLGALPCAGRSKQISVPRRGGRSRLR